MSTKFLHSTHKSGLYSAVVVWGFPILLSSNCADGPRLSRFMHLNASMCRTRRSGRSR